MKIPFVLLAALAVVAPILQAQTWTVVYLHPTGLFRSDGFDTTDSQQAGDVDLVGNGDYHAAIWSGSAASFIDLNPLGYSSSFAVATTGSQQAGSAVIGGSAHAVIWSGTPGSFVDLNPLGASESTITDTTGTSQVGNATLGGVQHAAIWTGTPGSFVDLNPPGADSSSLSSVDATGSLQGGYAVISGTYHAGIWSGSAGSFVDLQPSSGSNSNVESTTLTQQSGYAEVGGEAHAGLWTGTPGSFVDLNPVGARFSFAHDTDGTQQVGEAVPDPGVGYYAVIWSGTAASVVNLQSFLTSDYTDSRASGIWTDGSHVVVTGEAYNATADRHEAVLWTFTPAHPHPPLPHIVIGGSHSIATSSAKLAITGTATDAAKVQFKVGKASYKTAKGTTKWKFTATHLLPGKTTILVRAVSSTGEFSPTVKVTVIRK